MSGDEREDLEKKNETIFALSISCALSPYLTRIRSICERKKGWLNCLRMRIMTNQGGSASNAFFSTVGRLFDHFKYKINIKSTKYKLK